jgi:CubicO group peptidase (beta-lactamase class C family)
MSEEILHLDAGSLYPAQEVEEVLKMKAGRLRTKPAVSVRRYGLPVVTILCALIGVRSLAAQVSIEQQIKAGLVPPVVVKDEPLALTPLSTRMKELLVSAVSIAVIHNGKLEWAGGFGTRDQKGSPVTVDTLFQAGSIGKPLTAVAVMKLVQDRKLDLDTDVSQYLKSWKIPPSSFTDHNPVTLRELLSHSAGVNVSGFGGYEAGAPVPTLTQVLNGEPPARTQPIRVDVAPGTIFRYSGGGYVIVQQALTDTTGTPFPRLMRERVLVPFGMRQSSFEQPLTADLQARAAIPYAADGTPLREGPHIYPEMAPAGLWTTSSDLARFAIGIQQALAGRSDGVLSQAIARSMLNGLPQGLHVPATRGRRPGLGLFVGGKTDRKFFEHNGGNAGYAAYVMAYDSGDGVAVMINKSGNDASRLTDDIVRTIAYVYDWPDFAPAQRTLTTIAPADFDRYVGAYQSDSGALATFWRGEHLNARIWEQPASEIFPTSTLEYFSRMSDRRWTFSGAGGSVAGVKLSENGDERVFTRLDDGAGRNAVERSIELERRIKNQTPAPGGEQALLESIAGVMNGNPNYAQMVPEFGNLVRRILPGLQKMFGEYGPAKSASFKRVRPDGLDVYSVMFETGPRDLEILFAPDGRICNLMFNR